MQTVDDNAGVYKRKVFGASAILPLSAQSAQVKFVVRCASTGELEMEILILIFFWLAFAAAVGAWANNKGRSGVGFFFLALLLSPLIGEILSHA